MYLRSKKPSIFLRTGRKSHPCKSIAVYELIHRLASDGLGVLLISSELEEILGLAHRVLVVRNGKIVADLAGDIADEETVMRATFGESNAPIEGEVAT